MHNPHNAHQELGRAASRSSTSWRLPGPSERPPVPRQVDVVIAGGGIIGLSLAFELSRRRVPVAVLERDWIGAGAAGVAAGMLAPAAEAEHEDDAMVRLALESQRLYPSFVAEAERLSGRPCGLRQEGSLLVALTRDDAEEWHHLQGFQQRLGLASRWLEPDEVLALEPQLTPRLVGALFCPQDYQVDPRAMMAALAEAVRRLGGTVVEGARVTGFETAGGRVQAVVGRLSPDPPAARGEGEAFAVGCQAAVLAAGAWSGLDLAWPGAPIPVRPVKGQLVRLRGPQLIRHVVRTPRVYLVPRLDGELIVGGTVEEQGFDPTPTAGAVSDLLWGARLVVPAVYDLAWSEVNVGFRPASRDHLPIMGPAGVDGLYVATGHFRNGILLAPATAALMADLLVDGRRSPLLEPFAPQRPGLAGPAGDRLAAPSGPGQTDTSGAGRRPA